MGVFGAGAAQGFAQGAELVRRHQQAKEENELQRKLLKLREDMFAFESKKLQSALTGQESLAQMFEGFKVPMGITPEESQAEMINVDIPPEEMTHPLGKLAAALTRAGQPKEAVGLLGLGERKPLQEVPQGTIAGTVGGRRVLLTPPKEQREPTAPEARMFEESVQRHRAQGKTPEQAFNLAKNELATFRAQSAGLTTTARETAQIQTKPLSEADKQAMASYNTILSSIEQFKTFSPEEVTTFVGLLQRPTQEALMTLRGLPAVGGFFGRPDERYTQFRALLGRLQGTAFGEGGKQLTPFESSVVFNYTPTGREPGGAEQILAKLRNLETFTRISRSVRLKLAKTPKGEIDVDELDRLLKTEMDKAGLALPVPGQTSPSSPDIKSTLEQLRQYQKLLDKAGQKR